MSISQQDLNVRLQLTGYAFGELANTYANDLKYGKKCATTNMRTLMLLQAYLELMQCYKVNIPEVQSVGGFQITTLTLGFTLEVFVNGVSITGLQTATTTNRNTAMHALVNIINSYQSTYTAVIDQTGDLHSVILYGPCTGGIVTYETNADKGEIILTTTDLKDGVCGIEYENCLTEDQMLTIFYTISKITKICFKPLGFTYEE